MLFVLIGVEGALAAGQPKAAPTAPAVTLSVANPSFEGLGSTPNQPLVVTDDVPGWDLLPDSIVRVVNNSAAGVVDPADVDGMDILMIITGGVSQVLNTTIQPATDYTFSVRALRRLDLPKLYPIEIQFLSNGRVLASCDSHTNPDQSADSPDMEIVALTYRTGVNNSAIGGPLEIRIMTGLPLPDGHSFGSSYADNVLVTAGPSGTPSVALGSACSILR
jgi:hypothetical protein